MKYTLLYIDDEDDNLNVFKSTFRHQYTVLTANSVKAAIPLLREIPVHVIISDYKMPGENGVEFFKNIKSEWPNIERIILTA
ncbi:MAG: response regulator, partial [Bacteroidota bacterium]